MSEMSLLTCELVNDAVPPLSGERWIGDTKVRGFGLRMWRSPRGLGKAFAIRIATKDGKIVRRTFDSQASQTYRKSSNSDAFQLGDCLLEARKWARDTIAKLNGNLTGAQKQQLKLQYAHLRLSALTLDGAADHLLEEMRRQHRSDRYIDSIEKLYSKKIRERLGVTRLYDVDIETIAGLLVDRDLSPGSIRTLKSFLNQVFRRAARHDGSLLLTVDKINQAFWPLWEAQRDVRYPELRDLTKEDFATIFARLERERTYWQQAFCIRLFFKFGSPLSRVMSAEWAQFMGNFWYPYYAKEKKLWFESRESLDDEAIRLLWEISRHIAREFGSSIYLFPSRHGRIVKHIRSIDTVWRNTLHDLRIRHYSLWEFAKSYRDPNNPSYLGFFIKHYGPGFRREARAELIARKLRRRRGKADSTNLNIAPLKDRQNRGDDLF